MVSESFYCLTTSDGNSDAYSIFQKRIAEKKWPLYKQTKYQNVIKSNDNLIFYIAGVNEFRQCFVASGKVKEIKRISIETETTVDPDKTEAKVTSYIYLNDVKLFKEQIPIKSIINNLKFIENKKKYGFYFVGGITKIDKNSNNFILNQAN